MTFKLVKFDPFQRFSLLAGVGLVLINLGVSYIVVSVMKHLPGLKKII